MSFLQTRDMMMDVEEHDFSGATVLTVDPSKGRTFSLYSAVPIAGVSRASVDWGDGVSESIEVDSSGKIPLTHTYSGTAVRTVRIQNVLSSLHFSFSELHSAEPYVLKTAARHTGAEALTAVVSLGTNITNRTLSPGLFAGTSITAYPSIYGLPALSTTNASVLCIPLACFYECQYLSSLTGCPGGVVVIDAFAFYGCSSLESVQGLATTVLKHVGFKAFCDCTALTSLSGINTALNPTPSNVFGGNIDATGLAEQMFPNPPYNVSSMRAYRLNMFMYPLAPNAFEGCSNLTDISGLLVTSGARIPFAVFLNCSNLASIPSIYSSATFYRDQYQNEFSTVFHNSTMNIPPHTISSGTPASAYGYGYDAHTGYGPFSGTSVTTTIGLTNKFRVIPDLYFANCTKITSVTLDRNDTDYHKYYNIGVNTFSGCTALKTVSFPYFTKAEVQENIGRVTGRASGVYNRPSYAFGLPSGCVITCSDGTLTV